MKREQNSNLNKIYEYIYIYLKYIYYLCGNYIELNEEKKLQFEVKKIKLRKTNYIKYYISY